jgi:flagellar basal-body rod protein FlgF
MFMIRGIISGVMAMRAQVGNQEVIANNLANVSTAAYNRDCSVLRSFSDCLMYRMNKAGAAAIGVSTGGTVIQDVRTIHSVGPLETTDNPLDIALSAGTYLAVETPSGILFTRRGDLEVTRDGYLTVGGFRVMGAQGPIIVDSRDLVIREDGSILSRGRYVDTLRLVTVTDTERLEKVGSSLVIIPDEALEISEDVVVTQGALEKSSVNPVTEMVSLIHTMRLYEAAQRLIQSQDQALDQAVNRVGRV